MYLPFPFFFLSLLSPSFFLCFFLYFFPSFSLSFFLSFFFLGGGGGGRVFSLCFLRFKAAQRQCESMRRGAGGSAEGTRPRTAGWAGVRWWAAPGHPVEGP